MINKLRCFFGFHKWAGELYWKKEYFINAGMNKIRVYDCINCGKEFVKII